MSEEASEISVSTKDKPNLRGGISPFTCCTQDASLCHAHTTSRVHFTKRSRENVHLKERE